jgi:hypothetical protein
MTAELDCHRHMIVGLPNNSLKLTRRAALSGRLVSPADQAYSGGVAARFRRAA